MTSPLSVPALDQIFRQARTFNAWQSKQVGKDVLHELYNLVKFGPTSANCSPARFVFITTDDAKERLLKHVSNGNQDKTRTAPVTAIVAYDMAFHDHLPKLFPHTDAKSWFTGNDELVKETAFRNGSLQGAYLIVAARALGLDAGPMSGFDNDGVDREFFAGTSWKSNFLCNLGYGDATDMFDRSPRFSFDEAARIL